MNDAVFETTVILELMGHRVLAGAAREVEMLGTNVLRIDVPLPGGTSQAQFYTASAIFGMTPCTSEQLESWREQNQETLARANMLLPDERAKYQQRIEAQREEYRRRMLGDGSDDEPSF